MPYCCSTLGLIIAGAGWAKLLSMSYHDPFQHVLLHGLLLASARDCCCVNATVNSIAVGSRAFDLPTSASLC